MAHRERPYDSDSASDDYHFGPRRNLTESHGQDAAGTTAREQALAQLQLEDLSKRRSDRLRTLDPRDKSRTSAVDETFLARSRLSNVEGTPEYMRRQQAAMQIRAWGNFHANEDIPEEGEIEDIRFNDGQSHREGLQKAFHPEQDSKTDHRLEERTRQEMGHGDARNNMPHRTRPTKPPKQLEKEAARARRPDENAAGNNRRAGRQQPAHTRNASNMPHRPSPRVSSGTTRAGLSVQRERPEAQPEVQSQKKDSSL